ncbi:putative lipid kinase YegS-like protein [Gemmatimonadetes bacterium T265]|nr:putative lipid kinase YegS-like protein [Gemmatimonadetes bacterium T265]
MPDSLPLDIIVHGARAGSPDLRAAVTELRARGRLVRVHVTWERGDARRLARRAARSGGATVVAAGGDGTLNEVLNGVLAVPPEAETPVSIGLVPLGTANDFARQADVPLDPRAALHMIATGTPVRVDVGRVNGRAFLNVSTLGGTAEVTSGTDATTKRRLGVLAYALSGVRHLVAHDVSTVARISGPAFTREVPFVLLAVGNARATGGGTVVTPLAALDDGLLDVCVIEPVARLSAAKLLLELRRGEHLERDGVHYVQTPWLRVEAPHALAANVDGEPIRARVLHYAVDRGAALLHVGRLPGRDTPDAA